MKKQQYSMLISLVLSLFMLIAITGCTQKMDDGKIPVSTSSTEALADFEQGRQLFEKLRQRESLQHFENAFAKDPEFVMAYYYHGLANPTTKGFFEDLDNAVAHIEKVSDGEKLIVQALQAGVAGDQKKQEAALTKLVELYPKDERAHGQLGQFYFGQQKYDMAVDHLRKSTELEPTYSSSYNMLGYSYRSLKNYAAAEKSFKKYIELIPDDPNPYDSYAELLMKMGDYEESIAQYEKALSLNPDFFASHMGISNNYVFMKKYDEARKNCEECLTMARNNGEKRAAIFNMAIAWVAEGEYDKALEEINKMYDLAKKINDFGPMGADLATMGNILFEAGRYAESLVKYNESLQTILDSDLSDDVKANNKRFNLYNKGRIAAMTGKMDEAMKNATNFADQASAANNTFQIWLSHDLKGLIALKEEDYKTAVDEYMMANQQNPYTHYYLALAYKGLGNKEDAKMHCESSANFNALASMNQAFVQTKAEKMLTHL